MRKITIVWTITLLIIVGGLTVIGLKIKNDNITNIMETDLVNKAEKYMGLYPGLFPKTGEVFKITNEELKTDGYNAELEDDCDGYIIITGKEVGFEYKAYIKCPDYITEGYEE